MVTAKETLKNLQQAREVLEKKRKEEKQTKSNIEKFQKERLKANIKARKEAGKQRFKEFKEKDRQLRQKFRAEEKAELKAKAQKKARRIKGRQKIQKKVESFGSKILKKRIVGTARAKIPSGDPVSALTPKQRIALVREAQHTFEPQPSRSIFFQDEWINEKKKMGWI